MATSTPLPSRSPEETDNPGQEEFDKLVRHSISPEEERAMEKRASEDQSEEGSEASEELEQLQNRAESSDASKSLYKRNGPEKKGFASRLNGSYSVRRYLIVGGFTAAFIGVVVLILGFLNVFKLDGLMSSIEQRAFLRQNATLDTRSSKWINSYVEARLMDMGDNPNLSNPDFKKDDNLLFRANRVDTNNPFFDWYRTLRTSKFEQEVFEKHGIKFTSMVTADGKFRTGLIDINGEKPIPISAADISNADFKKLSEGDVATIRKFGDIVYAKEFSGNKEARAAIKKVVNDNTHWTEVYKRRSLRKAIQNMTGVKDWRFFETTRDKVSQKKVDIRNKIIDKMVPDKIFIGRVTRCLFGVDKCDASRDIDDSQNQAINDESIGTEKTQTDQEKAAEDKKIKGTDGGAFTPGELSDTLKQILNQANLYLKLLNIPSTLDMLSYVNDNISQIVKLVVVARGAQAAGLFQVFETSRDQLKTGQVTSGEVNDFMNVVSSAGSSDGQAKVVEGKGDPSVSYNSGACSEDAQALYDKNPDAYKKKYGIYAYLCDNQRIGSAANAQKVQDAYNNSVGLLIGPIASAWEGANNTPIIGSFFHILDWLSSKLSNISNFVVQQVLSILHLQDDVQGAVTWIFGKLANFLGVVILNGNELPGTFYNWLIQGGAYSAESASRQEGAALTNNNSLGAAQRAIASYQRNQNEDTGIYDKVASLSNPDSLAFKGAYALSDMKSDPSSTIMTGFAGIWKSMSRNFGLVFGHSLAATPDGYAASKFAGIETYDYPQQCYDLDPVTAQPLDGTNAITIFQQNNIPVPQDDYASLNSWDTETDSQTFYNTIYDIIRSDSAFANNADDIAVHIYNCNLLDTSVRGSLGYVFGYTKDNADLVGGSTSTTTSSASQTDTGGSTGTVPSASLQALAKQILDNANISYPYDSISKNGSTKTVLQALEQGQAAPVTCRDGSAQGITSADLNPKILQAILEMAQSAKIGVNALTDKCHTAGSNHYKGLAVDFECQGVVFDVNKNDAIASKYGGQRNSETCSADGHWHYDFLTR
jgi:hypothetical protein